MKQRASIYVREAVARELAGADNASARLETVCDRYQRIIGAETAAIGKSFSKDELKAIEIAGRGVEFSSAASAVGIWALIAEAPQGSLPSSVTAAGLSEKVRALSDAGRIALVEMIERRRP